MEKYLGVKEILAKPMTRKEYNDYRNWELPDDECGEDEGFLVEYLNGSASNHPNHKGYISWSPDNVFDEAYTLLTGGGIDPVDFNDSQIEPYLMRLYIEYDGLTNKIYALTAALENKKIPAHAIQINKQQLIIMQVYAEVLKIKINFNDTNTSL